MNDKSLTSATLQPEGQGQATEAGMDGFDRWNQIVLDQLGKIRATQSDAIRTAAGWLADVLASGRTLYLFGTGHSHLLALEPFYRAGGLASAVPILDDALMLHVSASESTQSERREGWATGLLANYPVGEGDLLWIFSNSGRNTVPIDLAIEARKRGARVLALCNRAHASEHRSRHISGKNLIDMVDLTIDNCGVAGDAAVRIEGVEGAVGPTSTVMGAYILQGVIVLAVELALKRGWKPELYCSSNAGGEAHNEALLQKYRAINPHL